MSAGAAVTFKGGPADGHVTVWPTVEPPEFLDYRSGESDEVSYRHLARPNDKSPYHVYVPFEKEEGEVA
jgi:hypothetical protein